MNLNESRNDNPSEILQMVKDFKRIKEDNERILETQEEQNNGVLTKIDNIKEEKNTGPN